MILRIDPLAQLTINEIAELTDGINTPGAGERWLDELLDFIIGYAKPSVGYALCHNSKLAAQGYSCIIFNNWVIAFTISEDVFTVHLVIHGSLLL